MTLDDRIRQFSNDPAIILECLALLKVGIDRKETPQSIMQHVVCSVLLRFHEIHPSPPFPMGNATGKN